MFRQHVYDLEKRRGDCLMKWLIMLGFMDLRGLRVCRRSTPVLFLILVLCSYDSFNNHSNNSSCYHSIFRLVNSPIKLECSHASWVYTIHLICSNINHGFLKLHAAKSLHFPWEFPAWRIKEPNHFIFPGNSLLGESRKAWPESVTSEWFSNHAIRQIMAVLFGDSHSCYKFNPEMEDILSKGPWVGPFWQDTLD